MPKILHFGNDLKIRSVDINGNEGALGGRALVTGRLAVQRLGEKVSHEEAYPKQKAKDNRSKSKGSSRFHRF